MIARCDKCRAEIIWTQRDRNRKWVPIDARDGKPVHDTRGCIVIAQEIVYKGRDVKLVRFATKAEIADTSVMRYHVHMCLCALPTF